MYAECSSSYIMAMCCVIFFVLLLRWWSCSRRQADAKSFLPALVVRSGLARVGVTSTTSGPSRLDCTGALFRYRSLCPSGWKVFLLSLACYAPHGTNATGNMLESS